MKIGNWNINFQNPYLSTNAIEMLSIGQKKLYNRIKELKMKKEINSWITICPFCFQQLRLPAFKGVLLAKCPICNNERSIDTSNI